MWMRMRMIRAETCVLFVPVSAIKALASEGGAKYWPSLSFFLPVRPFGAAKWLGEKDFQSWFNFDAVTHSLYQRTKLFGGRRRQEEGEKELTRKERAKHILEVTEDEKCIFRLLHEFAFGPLYPYGPIWSCFLLFYFRGSFCSLSSLFSSTSLLRVHERSNLKGNERWVNEKVQVINEAEQSRSGPKFKLKSRSKRERERERERERVVSFFVCAFL